MIVIVVSLHAQSTCPDFTATIPSRSCQTQLLVRCQPSTVSAWLLSAWSLATNGNGATNASRRKAKHHRPWLRCCSWAAITSESSGLPWRSTASCTPAQDSDQVEIQTRVQRPEAPNPTISSSLFSFRGVSWQCRAHAAPSWQVTWLALQAQRFLRCIQLGPNQWTGSKAQRKRPREGAAG